MTETPYTVVIADDDADIRDLVSISVRKAGLRVLAAVGDGAAALDAIRTNRPDLAILDISMPELNGMDVCRAVRADAGIGDVRILLLSASVDEAAVNLGIESGADYFMAKPFSPREMVEWLAVGKEAR
ncbi:response regulator transcription factor [Salinibacterium soli]|uniref:Response regulator n=1 Tax=Antiquaquibacter soli TaxID=3064523 RepID=A0ABT9BK25_9MICO|nr:response regulator [Protaetiibacter sp. WY-16]MDO7881373.1 response regulator [Protaetiibacter sp. WY-16]